MNLTSTKLSRAVLAALLPVSVPAFASPAGGPMEATFDPRLLTANSGITDLSRFARGNPVYPGVRELDIYLNGQWVAKRPLRFEAPSPDVDATICVDDEILIALGVRKDRVIAPPHGATISAPACQSLAERLPGAGVEVVDSDMRVNFHIAQADLASASVGSVDPQAADKGVNALRLNYAANSYRLHGDGGDQNRSHLQLDAGVNLGGWQLRHRSSQTWGAGGRKSDTLAAYAQTSIPSRGLELTLGEFNTPGAVFDSIGLRGIRLSTDDRMRPESERGYAPVVRGTARSNALVTVTQNGSVIREITVPAGNFELHDLYPTGYGGDLTVVVTESDGSQSSFSVPYSSVPELMREGAGRIGVSLGQWSDGIDLYQPDVVQIVGQYGFTTRLTGYVGKLDADGYQSTLVGSAVNTPIGAFAFDATHAKANVGDRRVDVGNSLRLSYGNFLPSSQTAILVAAHRYASKDFWSLNDLVAFQNDRLFGYEYQVRRIRNRLDLQVDQPLAGGSLYASATLRNFWDGGDDEQFVQLGYARNFKSMSFSAGMRRTLSALSDNTQWTFSVSLPLGNTVRHSGRLFGQATYDEAGARQSQLAMTGSVGERRQLSYGVAHSYVQDGDHSYTSLNSSYQGAYANIGATHGFGSQAQTSLSVEGGLLAHAGGITAGQVLGDTVGIAVAKDAAGARISSSSGVKLDKRGNAILPSLVPYRKNLVQVDPAGLSPDIQFETTTREITPRAGAIVVVPFETSSERSWLLRALKSEDGAPLPLGTRIVDDSGAVLGTIDRTGYAFLRGNDADNALRAEWGGADGESCTLAGETHRKQPEPTLVENVVYCLIGNEEKDQ